MLSTASQLCAENKIEVVTLLCGLSELGYPAKPFEKGQNCSREDTILKQPNTLYFCMLT